MPVNSKLGKACLWAKNPYSTTNNTVFSLSKYKSERNIYFMIIDAKNTSLHFEDLNKQIRNCKEDIIIENCLGQRFIGCGEDKKTITINGTPGNEVGAYLNGAKIVVNGNTQEATGNTMNAGEIIIHGSTGDHAGYAMRGGAIYVKKDAGYRAGIHMKAYHDKLPVMVIGGKCGSFLGEYQAGGIIIVLGLGIKGNVVSHFCGTGMHGGKIIVRCDQLGVRIPDQLKEKPATKKDLEEIKPYIKKFCRFFSVKEEIIYDKEFVVLTPNTSSPYKQLYIQN